jgi:hypothetical protein
MGYNLHRMVDLESRYYEHWGTKEKERDSTKILFLESLSVPSVGVSPCVGCLFSRFVQVRVEAISAVQRLLGLCGMRCDIFGDGSYTEANAEPSGMISYGKPLQHGDMVQKS